MSTKYQKIIEEIESLEIGAKLSIKSIAQKYDVSEGTAYRAIKGAEAQGLVSTTPKAGTIRIDNQLKGQSEALTFKMLVQMMNGTIIAGVSEKELIFAQIVVATSESHDLNKHKGNNTLCIVGDREDIQEYAIENRIHLLITGEAAIAPRIIALAKKYNVAIVKTMYDTFKVISIINLSFSGMLVEPQSFLVKAFMKDPICLYRDSRVSDWYNLSELTSLTQFPVVDDNMNIMGVVSSKEVSNLDPLHKLVNALNVHILKISPEESVTAVANLMLSEGQSTAYVIDDTGRLQGSLSLQDIIENLHRTENLIEMNTKYESNLINGFRLSEQEEKTILSGRITSSMLDDQAGASWASLVTLLTFTVKAHLRRIYKADSVIENLDLHQLRPISFNTMVSLTVRVLQLKENSCLVNVKIYSEKTQQLTGLMTARLINGNH